MPTRNASGFDLSQKDPARHPRWDHIVNIVDRNGRLVESWEQHNKLFVRPHRVLVSPYDAERHVWLVDDGAHAIYKFTRDGKQLVMTLGTPRVPGNDETHFARPTDVAFLPDGTFFVSDGYTNTRVVKFDRNGKYLTTWGMRGTPPNETRPYYMNTVHAVVTDKQRRVYISDRANHRIQIFDENGKFLDAWPNVPLPYSLLMTDDQFLWSASGETQKFTKYDLNGRLLAAWGTFGAFPGGFWGVHQFHVDSEGSLYTADVHVGRPAEVPSSGRRRSQPAHRGADANGYRRQRSNSTWARAGVCAHDRLSSGHFRRSSRKYHRRASEAALTGPSTRIDSIAQVPIVRHVHD